MSPSHPQQSPSLKLYSLEASRSIRIAWLLEELGLPYENHEYKRLPNMRTPPQFAAESGSEYAKAPVLKAVLGGGEEEEVVVVESGAITEFILENYDTANVLSGKSSPGRRHKVLTFIHAAEGVFMLHGLAPYYARAFAPDGIKGAGGPLEEMVEKMTGTLRRDLDWLERELGDGGADGGAGEGKEKEKGKGRYLVGYDLTAADTMMLFGIQFLFKKGLVGRGFGIEKWPAVEKWVERCEAREGWKRAVEKTGFAL